jgi:hypothetical protein
MIVLLKHITFNIQIVLGKPVLRIHNVLQVIVIQLKTLTSVPFIIILDNNAIMMHHVNLIFATNTLMYVPWYNALILLVSI